MLNPCAHVNAKAKLHMVGVSSAEGPEDWIVRRAEPLDGTERVKVIEACCTSVWEQM